MSSATRDDVETAQFLPSWIRSNSTIQWSGFPPGAGELLAATPLDAEAATGVPADEWVLIEATPRTWPDAGLGCVEAGGRTIHCPG